MNDRITQLENQVRILTDFITQLQSSNTLPLFVDNALGDRLVSKGFLKNGKSGVNTYYVSLTSGGLVTTAVTFTNGAQTS